MQTAGGATLHPTSSLAGSFPGTNARKELNTVPIYSTQAPPYTPTHTTQRMGLPQIFLSSCPCQPWEQEHIESSVVLTASHLLPFYRSLISLLSLSETKKIYLMPTHPRPDNKNENAIINFRMASKLDRKLDAR